MKTKLPCMMIVVLTLALPGIFLLAGVTKSADVPMITKEVLQAMFGKEDVTILDVRMDVEWESSEVKIKGAVWENPKLFDIWAEKYPKDKTLVLYCA